MKYLPAKLSRAWSLHQTGPAPSPLTLKAGRLVIDEGDVTNIMDEFQKTCDEPATIKHGGHWFCEHHYELFFTMEEQ